MSIYHSNPQPLHPLARSAMEIASTCIISVEATVFSLSPLEAAYIWCRALFVLSLVTAALSLGANMAEHLSADYARFWNRLNQGEFCSGRYKRVGKGGHEVWLEASYSPILDLNQKPFKIVKYATDISQHHRASQALATNVKTMVSSLSSSSVELRATAEALASVAERTTQQSTVVASAAEELAASVGEIAHRLSQSNAIVAKAVEDTDSSQRQVAELVHSADEIGAQVKGIQIQSNGTSGAMNQIADTITHINTISTSIAAAVEEQSAATREVTLNINAVKASAEQTAASSANLISVAGAIAKEAASLETSLSAFLASL